MKLSFLRPLYQRPGPWASLYLDASHDTEDAAKAVALRWRGLREQLSGQGADPDTLTAIDAALAATDPAPGRSGLAVFAAGGEAVLVEHLSDPPARETAVWSARPQVAALVAARSDQVRWVRVVVDHTGGDLTSVDSGRLRVTGSAEHPVHKTGTGGWSALRYEHATEESWQRNARNVAEALTAFVDRAGADVVVVAGEPRSRQLLCDRLPKRIADLVVSVDGSRAPGAASGPLDDVTVEAVTRVAAESRRATLDRYRMDAARQLAVDGLPAVTGAARGAGVGVLLLTRQGEPPSVWIDPAVEPAETVLEVATDQQTLRDLGVAAPVPEAADAALLAVAAVSDAEAVTVAPDEQPLADGIGAILRYPT